jgi:hypothetical protein
LIEWLTQHGVKVAEALKNAKLVQLVREVIQILVYVGNAPPADMEDLPLSRTEPWSSYYSSLL